jgi:hypothetical protein
MRARWGEECWATWEGDGSRGRRDRRCGGPPGSGGKTIHALALAAMAAKPYEGGARPREVFMGRASVGPKTRERGKRPGGSRRRPNGQQGMGGGLFFFCFFYFSVLALISHKIHAPQNPINKPKINACSSMVQQPKIISRVYQHTTSS